jgi:hypothetical protein
MSAVKSVTCICDDAQEQYNDPLDITVYTDDELTTEQQTTLQTLITNYPNPMYDVIVNAFRKISIVNSTEIPLYPESIFHGQWEDVSNYATITIFVACDNKSAEDGLELHFSTDAIASDFIKKITVFDTGSSNQITVTTRYFKVIYKNNGSKSNLKIQTIYNHYRNKEIGTNIASIINDSVDCQVTRSIINGRLQNRTYVPVNATPNGQLETTITGPITAFGELLISPNTPILQHDFIYSIDPNSFKIYQQNNGTVTQLDGMALCTTAAETNSIALIRSRKALRYRPGQGSMALFTAIFDTPKEGNDQFIGFGNTESGLLFGYKNTTFGIFYTNLNKRQLHTITITTKSSDTQNVIIVLGGVSFSVPVTDGADTAYTAAEISKYNYTTSSPPGWIMSAVGSTVYVGCLQAILVTGEFSITFPTSGEATIVQNQAGLNITQHIPQSSWNIDVLDGSGSIYNPSSTLIDPSKGNIYYIKFQYLGFGYLEFGVEDSTTTKIIPVHRIKHANNFTVTNLSNPTLEFVLTSKNKTNDTAVTIKSPCCAGFVQGKIHHLGVLSSLTKTKLGITDSMTHIFTIRSKYIWHNKFNMKNIVPKILSISNFGTNFVEIYIIRYGVLDNNENFTDVDGDVSVAEVDYDSLTVTQGQVKYSSGLTSSENLSIDLENIELFIEHNSTLSIVAKTITGTTDISCSFTYAED